ncbi:MAG: YtpR family tRNA-binding protein [Lactovum sp.]
MIAFFNENIGKVLMLVLADSQGTKLKYERKGSITRVFREDTGQTVAWNFFDKTFEKNGEIQLSDQEISKLEAEILKVGFSEQLETEASSNFKVAQIVEMVDHPDSDHLHICQVDIGEKNLVQIVCGAANAREGLKTVAALPISLMPNGTLIFDGTLRAIESKGMLCSAKELNLESQGKIGIIELDSDLVVGSTFNF